MTQGFPLGVFMVQCSSQGGAALPAAPGRNRRRGACTPRTPAVATTRGPVSALAAAPALFDSPKTSRRQHAELCFGQLGSPALAFRGLAVADHGDDGSPPHPCSQVSSVRLGAQCRYCPCHRGRGAAHAANSGFAQRSLDRIMRAHSTGSTHTGPRCARRRSNRQPLPSGHHAHTALVQGPR